MSVEESIIDDDDISDMYLSPSKEGDDAALMKCIVDEPKLDLSKDMQEVMDLYEELKRKKQFKKVDNYTSGRPRKSYNGRLRNSEAFDDESDFIYPLRHTDDAKKRMSVAHRREYLSPASLERMRQAKLGKKLSDETKKKISDANLGRRLSEATKEKMRQAKLGKKRVKKDV